MAGRERPLFLVARNPDGASRLPYLVRLPVDGGLVLKTRAPWPTTARVYCHLHESGWPDDAELVEEVPATLCQRRGPAIGSALVGSCSRCRREAILVVQPGPVDRRVPELLHLGPSAPPVASAFDRNRDPAGPR